MKLKALLRWWMVWVGILVGLLAGLVVNAVVPKTYTASAVLFLGSPASADSAGAYSGDLFSQQRASTYTNLFGSSDLAVKVIDDLQLQMTPTELAAKVTASQVPKAVLLDVSATDGSAQRAADIANAYAAAFPQYVARLETPAGATQPSSSVTVIQNAETPTAPTAPNALLNLLVAVFAGAVIGLLAHWAKGILRRVVQTPAQVFDAVGAPVLGVLPKDGARTGSRVDMTADAATPYAEAIRKLRTNLLYVDVDNPPKTVAFVSPASGVSSTATATNLAVALAAVDLHAVVVDADLRKPRLANYVKVEAEQGLSTVLAGDASVDDVVVQIAGTHVDLVASGPTTAAASELLASDVMTKTIAELRNGHDFVFCDTPGLLAATDGAVISLACDGVVLVARQGSTRIEQMAEAAETLRGLGAKVLGAVLTDSR